MTIPCDEGAQRAGFAPQMSKMTDEGAQKADSAPEIDKPSKSLPKRLFCTI